MFRSAPSTQRRPSLAIVLLVVSGLSVAACSSESAVSDVSADRVADDQSGGAVDGELDAELTDGTDNAADVGDQITDPADGSSGPAPAGGDVGDDAADGAATDTGAGSNDRSGDDSGDSSSDDNPSDTTSGTAADGTTGRGDDDGETSSTTFEPDEIDWEPANDAVDTGTLSVPVDYDDPTGDQFELYVARFNALDQDNKIGSLLVNPGGPGSGGSDYAFYAAQSFDPELLENFDIIGWDPRGAGLSEPPIDCIDDYDPYFVDIDSTPENGAEHAALVDTAEDFARQCIGRNTDTLQHVGTNNSARDMDALRRSLGEDQISYFGFSYGSELGAVWATMFPDTVRAAVLDGAADPGATSIESSLQQYAAFEASLETFLARCSDDDDCDFHNDGDARAAFIELMAALDADPVVGDPERPLVNRDVATTAVVQAMYSDAFWPVLERSLRSAQQGDGSGLLALNDAYYRRSADGTYSNLLEAFQAISCADTSDRPTVAESDAEGPAFTEVAPLLVPEGAVPGYFCTFFPEALDPRIDVDGDGAGPIVVIGTTGDPATPFESTEAMVETLEDGRLVVVEADQHTGYGVNRCVVDVVNDYLVDLVAPDSGTECR